MNSTAIRNVPWSPPPDDELTWFPAKGKLPLAPSPLEFTVEVNALFFGLTRALESLEFPLTEVRPRLVDGRLYIAVAPSADAEKDMRRRLQSVRDLSLRYTRDIRGFWQKQVKPKIEDYNRWLAQLAKNSPSSAELAEQIRQLRWVRGNQWFNIFRPVIAPTALMRRWADDAIAKEGSNSEEARSWLRSHEVATEVAREAFAAVEEGKAVQMSQLNEVGIRLVNSGAVETAADVYWLEWKELRNVLETGGSLGSIVAQRKTEASQHAKTNPPPTVGPPLPPDAPRMYLIKEILALVSQ